MAIANVTTVAIVSSAGKTPALPMTAAPDTIPGLPPLTVRVFRDELDGVWVAECLELPGCMSQGQTQHEALEHLADAVGGVLTVRMRRNIRDVPSADVDEESDRTVVLAL